MFQPIASFEGLVRRVDVAPLPGKRFRITAVLADQTGTVSAIWIRGGGVPSNIHEGVRLAVSGPIVTAGRQVVFENPEFEAASAPPLNTRRTVPVYPLTAGITQSFVRAIVRRAMDELPPASERLPINLLESEQLMPLDAALREMHAPASEERLEAARKRLSFDELLPIQMLVLQRRLAYQVVETTPVETPWSLLAEFRQRLPFALTAAQQRVLSTILQDMGRSEPMVRLLQGEVGSGKTVVAAMALLAAAAAGGQGALMAPTEILAEQHLRTLTRLYEGASPALEQALGHPLRLGFLSGALTRSERQRTIAAIADGELDLVIGTHAVIQSDVEFPELLLAVVDEQHRFGVNQRIAARRKGENPHLLVMTATPIPRTLALTLYGDLDLSLLDELPAGRQPIETVLLRPLGRQNAYDDILEQVSEGRQAFVICPLVEGSPSIEAKAATEEYERLRTGELFRLRLALLHGRMRPSDKDQVMRDFAAGEYDVLVATSVVEVGVDVPNATVMVIEGAERFGLAQLHQFRGRIGRGAHAGTCYLVAGNESPEAMERLEAVVRSSNGLELAEEDLRLRGPGDYFGVRQSGLPALRIARLTDLDLVQRVREAAAQLLESDPQLQRPEHAALADLVRQLGAQGGEAN
jgi:ATP-dependent DNA helicase RecG